jgi:hypothetical protein
MTTNRMAQATGTLLRASLHRCVSASCPLSRHRLPPRYSACSPLTNDHSEITKKGDTPCQAILGVSC